MSPTAPDVRPDIQPDLQPDLAAVEAAITRDGIAGLPGALGRPFAAELAEDFAAAFAHALSYPGGTVNRGPNRHYFGVPAERLRGFAALVANPWVAGVSRQVLGPEWEVVEVAFDVPRGGATYQPWHRDFPTPPLTARDRVLTSLAFNATTVDVTPDMGPFEIAPGTQWDDGSGWPHGMFPPRAQWPRYERLRQQRLARLGDMSVRTGLTIHRGSPNRTTVDRGVLILGVVGPEDPTPEHHRLAVTRAYHDGLPEEVRRHLRVRLVDALPERPRQEHDIEGLVMGVDPGE